MPMLLVSYAGIHLEVSTGFILNNWLAQAYYEYKKHNKCMGDQCLKYSASLQLIWFGPAPLWTVNNQFIIQLDEDFSSWCGFRYEQAEVIERELEQMAEQIKTIIETLNANQVMAFRYMILYLSICVSRDGTYCLFHLGRRT